MKSYAYYYDINALPCYRTRSQRGSGRSVHSGGVHIAEPQPQENGVPPLYDRHWYEHGTGGAERGPRYHYHGESREDFVIVMHIVDVSGGEIVVVFYKLICTLIDNTKESS